MRKRTGLALVALVITALIGAWLLGRSSVPGGSEPESAPASSSPHAAPSYAAESRSALPPADQAAPLPGAEDEAGGAPPSLSEVRDQVAENPHVTPQALLDFAHGQAEMMIQARQSEEAARGAFTRLENCANDPAGRTAPQARMVCLSNAKSLAEQYPDSLGPRFRTLAARNSQLMGMVEASGL